MCDFVSNRTWQAFGRDTPSWVDYYYTLRKGTTCFFTSTLSDRVDPLTSPKKNTHVKNVRK